MRWVEEGECTESRGTFNKRTEFLKRMSQGIRKEEGKKK